MKNLLSVFFIWGLILGMSAQKDTLHFEDEKDRADFEQFQKERNAQLVDSLNSAEMMDEEFYEKDEEGFITLNDLEVVGMPKFNSQLEKNYYYWLKRKLYNAYPFYLKAVKSYENLNDSLIRYEKDRKVKKYIKKRQKQLASEYEDKLRELTRTEGQILSKLMYKRTEKTTYEIISELRGSFNAYVWEAKAVFFEISLKTPFNPEEVREDFFLLNIYKRGITSGDLQHEDEVEEKDIQLVRKYGKKKPKEIKKANSH